MSGPKSKGGRSEICPEIGAQGSDLDGIGATGASFHQDTDLGVPGTVVKPPGHLSQQRRGQAGGRRRRKIRVRRAKPPPHMTRAQLPSQATHDTNTEHDLSVGRTRKGRTRRCQRTETLCGQQLCEYGQHCVDIRRLSNGLLSMSCPISQFRVELVTLQSRTNVGLVPASCRTLAASAHAEVKCPDTQEVE